MGLGGHAEEKFRQRPAGASRPARPEADPGNTTASVGGKTHATVELDRLVLGWERHNGGMWLVSWAPMMRNPDANDFLIAGLSQHAQIHIKVPVSARLYSLSKEDGGGSVGLL
jgi:hypothetical protein